MNSEFLVPASGAQPIVNEPSTGSMEPMSSDVSHSTTALVIEFWRGTHVDAQQSTYSGVDLNITENLYRKVQFLNDTMQSEDGDDEELYTYVTVPAPEWPESANDFVVLALWLNIRGKTKLLRIGTLNKHTDG